jgi:diguanylate cyclase (GGDEF)-like protein
VLAAIVASPADTALGQGLSLAYPIADVMVVTVLAIMWSRASAGTRAPLLIMIAGLALIAMSDSTFAYEQAQNSFGSGNIIDLGWVAGYLLVGLGALFSLDRPLRSTKAALPRWRAEVLPYLPVPLVMTFAAQERIVNGSISVFTLSIAVAVFLIVLLRQGLAARENMGLLRRLAINESELHHRAEHDPLTDLSNRGSFIRFVDEHLRWRTSNPLCAVLFVDLDDFKHINDSLGHAFGDRAIMVVGRRLQSCMRDGDLVARLGGDEFAIFLTNLRDVGQLVSIAERLIDALNEPLQSSDMRASVCGTIGVAIAEPGDDAGELLRRADIAMYAAMYAPLERRADLERAVDAEELTLHFQPLVDVPTRTMVGVEALLRWDHPRLGLLTHGVHRRHREERPDDQGGCLGGARGMPPGGLPARRDAPRPLRRRQRQQLADAGCGLCRDDRGRSRADRAAAVRAPHRADGERQHRRERGGRGTAAAAA